jgi:hypothetical protein
MGSGVSDISKNPEYDLKKFTNSKEATRPHNTMDSIGVRNAEPTSGGIGTSTQASNYYDKSSSNSSNDFKSQNSNNGLSPNSTYSKHFNNGNGENHQAVGVSNLAGSRTSSNSSTDFRSSKANNGLSPNSTYSKHFNNGHGENQQVTGVSNLTGGKAVSSHRPGFQRINTQTGEVKKNNSSQTSIYGNHFRVVKHVDDLTTKSKS